jgi:4-amino-4-deoxy-L-arabinose transferase-like glycosyltransferase
MKRNTVFLLLGILFFLISRFIYLTTLPIFNDESTYIRYGLHQLKEPDHAPYSLRIGKEPLLPFLYAVTGEVAGSPLLGARAVTILFGFLTLTGVYVFTRKVFDESSALSASLFYILAPFTVFFDRLALMDSPVSTVAIWSLYFTYKMVEKPRWTDAFYLGFVIGTGLWIKFTALFYLLLLLGVFIYYGIKHQKQIAEGTLSVKLFLPFLMAFCLFIPILSHVFYAEHWELLKQYSYPFFSVFTLPVDVWFANLSGVLQWLFFYMTPPLFLLSVGTLGFVIKKKQPLLVFWLVIPLLYQVLYAKTYTARHALPLTIPLFIAAGFGLSLLMKRNKHAAYGLIIIIFLWSTVHLFFLLNNPQAFPSTYPGRAKSDMMSYVYGFSSGYGIEEAVTYLHNEARREPITIVIRNDHGNPEDAIVAFLQYKENIRIIPLSNPEEDMKVAFQHIQGPVYFVSRGGFYAGLDKYFVSRKEFKKPNDNEFVGVYRLQQNSK